MKNKTFFTLLGLFFLIVLVGCWREKTKPTTSCTEFKPECEIQKKWSAVRISSKDSTSYDGFGNPTREGWYLYSSISKQVFPLAVISFTGQSTGGTPAHSLGEEGAGCMEQPRVWGIKWKVEKIQSNPLAFPGIQSQQIEVLCLSGGEISFLQHTGNEVGGSWKKY